MVQDRARRRTHGSRRGVTVVQWCVVAAMILLVSIALIRSLGNSTSTNLNSTAGNVANPATLPSRFGS